MVGRFGCRARLSLALLLTGALSAALAAETLDPEELEQLRERIQQTQSELESLEGRRDSVQSRLREVDRAVARASQRLAKTEDALSKTRQELIVARQRKREREEQLDQEHGALGQQVRALYQAGEQDALRVLLNQDDPRLTGRMLTWADYVSKARRDQIDAIQEALDDLEELTERIRHQEVELEDRQQAQVSQREALEERRRERQDVLARVTTEVRERSRDLEAMEKDEQRLERLLGGLRDAVPGKPINVGEMRGALDWPLKGRIRAAFGSRRESGLKWQGLFIGVPAGQRAIAPAPGRVVFADWMRGYGLLLIIDHGSGFMSLYGHNEGLLANVGEWVETGTAVSITGRSGGYDESGLYFELRREGSPVDPVAWLRPR